MPDYYCPDCCVRLVKNNKKLGHLSVWIVCPVCGYRTRPGSISYSEEKERDSLKSRIEENNKTGGYHNIND